MSFPAQVRIEGRFRGPELSGNGGYVCGLVGRLFEGPAEVTLRQFPPLDTPLDVDRSTPAAIRLCHAGVPIAEGRSAPFELEVRGGISFDDAQAAAARYPGFEWHPAAGCFVCGPTRAEGDGLRIFPGPVAGQDLVAAPWIPDESLDGGGVVAREFVWAALDCPAWFGRYAFDRSTWAVLGRMTVKIERAPRIGERCVALGWSLGSEGRKIFAASALRSDEDELLAAARSTWIVPKGFAGVSSEPPKR